MTETKKNENTEAIFDKKESKTNKYEKQAFFRPPLSEIVKDVLYKNNDAKKANPDIEVDEKDKQELASTLEALNDEQSTEVLVKYDPRNSLDYFKQGYSTWARDNSMTYKNQATIASKISFWLGSTLVDPPEKLGLPDYIYYRPMDRMVCFRGHFNPETIGSPLVSKYILYTNKYIIELNKAIANRLALCLLGMTLVLGGGLYITNKVSQTYNSFMQSHKSNEMIAKAQEDAKQQLLKDAADLVQKAKNNEITQDEFIAQKLVLKQREQEINKMVKQ